MGVGFSLSEKARVMAAVKKIEEVYGLDVIEKAISRRDKAIQEQRVRDADAAAKRIKDAEEAKKKRIADKVKKDRLAAEEAESARIKAENPYDEVMEKTIKDE